MHVAVVLLLSSAVIHIGVSQSLPTVLPSTETIAPPIQNSKCDASDRIPFFASNGIPCVLSIGTLTSPLATPTQVADALLTFCRDDCGGISSQFLESPCNDPPAAEFVRITCTPTNGSATIGDLCHYALPTISLDTQLFDELLSCDNVTSNSSCIPGCREILVKIKTQIGCCFQNVYNNTMYDIEQFLNNGHLSRSRFDRLKKIIDPDNNPWTACEIEPPQSCGASLFQPPASPNCTTDDHTAFLSSLPNAAVCGPSLGTVLSVSANDNPVLVENALDDVCTDNCGGAYSEFLKFTCNEPFRAETLRLWCTRTNGNSDAGPYCRFAADAALLSNLSSCSSVRQSCTPSCRSALLQFADKIGCCYQDVFNNTLYFHQLVLAGIITTSDFTDFTVFNNPLGNPWTVCNIAVPSKCPNQPPPDGKSL